MDRFLALYWHSEYKGKVSARHAVLATLATKLGMVLLTALVTLVLDPDILQVEMETMVRNHEEGPLLPTRAFSWLMVATTAFSFKNLLRHHIKRAK